jgi:hypothetical protein
LEEARRLPAFNQVEARLVAEYPMPGTDAQAFVIKLWAKGAPEV